MELRISQCQFKLYFDDQKFESKNGLLDLLSNEIGDIAIYNIII